MAESSSNNDKTSPVKSKKKPAKKKSASRKKATTRVGSSSKSRSVEEKPSNVTASPGPGKQPSVGASVDSTPSTNASATHSGNGIAWAALLVSIVALGAGGYAWYISAIQSKLSAGSHENRFGILEQRFKGFDTTQSDISSQLNQLRNQIVQAEESISTQVRAIRGELSEQDSVLREQIRNSEKMLESREAEFEADFEALSESIVKFRSELGRGIDSWTLEEAEQLIYIANQRLQFSGDVELSKTALQHADLRLREMADPGLTDVRQALASEIAALENVERVDTAGVLSAISVLSQRLSSLSLAGDLEHAATGNSGDGGETSGGVESPESSDSSGYFQPVIAAGAALLDSLGDLIQVERNGEAINPVISSEIRQLIYAKGQLILESAQIAFIRKNSELYLQRMDQTKTWVEQHFNMDSSLTQSWLDELGEISEITPQSELPDISGSLEALRAVIESQQG